MYMWLLASPCRHLFKVTVADGGAQYSFHATSKDDMLQWVESICSSKTLDPSPLLLYVTGGVVIHAGYMSCQEFASDASDGIDPLKPLRHKISDVDFSGAFSAIDYGKHWTVLRSSGLVQCLVKGRPETLVNLAECQRVKVNNPQEMRAGVDYCIEVENSESKFVLRADLPTEHCDWVLAIEQILKKLDHAQLLHGHRKRESGYVVLKRLLLTGQQPGGGGGGRDKRASQLYCFPKIFDDMEDIYEAPKVTHLPPPKEHPGPRSKLLQELPIPEPTQDPSLPGNKDALPSKNNDTEGNVVPLPPKDYLPPPLPPRSDVPPPIPPKAAGRSVSTVSFDSCSDVDDDYIMMQSSSTGPSPISTPLPSTPRSQCGMSQSPSQPVTIPNRRLSKKSMLLRTDSESSSYASSPPPIGGSSYSDGRKHSISNSYSLRNSNHSLNSYNSNMLRQVSVSSITSETPPLPPRNGEKHSNHSNQSPPFPPSPAAPSSVGRLSQSHTMGRLSSHTGPAHTHVGDSSKSDGMTVTELKRYQQYQHGSTTNGRHPISKASSVPRRHISSEGYESDHSSTEELPQVGPCSLVYVWTVWVVQPRVG